MPTPFELPPIDEAVAGIEEAKEDEEDDWQHESRYSDKSEA